MPQSSIQQQPADLRWVTAAAMAALARNGKTRKGATFTREELRKWEPGLVGAKLRNAVDRLSKLDFIMVHKPGCYGVTAVGAPAIKAAGAGQVLKCGQHGPKDQPPAAGSFAARLWALLRARQVLDTESAAATLIDAGDDAAAAESRAQSYLRKWERAGFVQSSSKRVAGGRKRYALVKDQPLAPSWEQLRQETAKKEGAAIAAKK